MARQLGATLIGLAIEPFSAEVRGDLAKQQHADQLLEPMRSRATEAGVSFRGVVSQASDISEAIVAEAEEQRADLIVMATHGRGAFGELLWGANTRRVMARTRVPMIVLRVQAALVDSGSRDLNRRAATRDRISA